MPNRITVTLNWCHRHVTDRVMGLRAFAKSAGQSILTYFANRRSETDSKMDRLFEGSKRLGEFIEMIVHQGVAIAFQTYCFAQLKSSRGFDKFTFAAAGIFALGMSLYLGYLIAQILALYFQRWWLSNSRHIVWQVISVILATSQYIAVQNAVGRFAAFLGSKALP
jgi:hypothetical protein